MTNNISIQNFKSIKNLNFEARRVNIFIGEPNTGKSNILEALGLFGFENTENLKDFIRYNNFPDIFFNNLSKVFIVLHPIGLTLRNENGIFLIEKKIFEEKTTAQYQQDGKRTVYDFGIYQNNSNFTKLYKFNLDKINISTEKNYGFLNFPFGSNLFEILINNEEIKQIVAGIKGWIVNICDEKDLQKFGLPTKTNHLHRIITSRLKQFEKLVQYLEQQENKAILHLKKILTL